MKRKNLTEKEEEQLAGIIDNEGFWYALSDGGYLTPEDVLDNPEDIKRVKEAIKIVKEFRDICPEL